MGKFPWVGIVLCHQVCLTRDRKTPSTILLFSSFLFTARCDKWLGSVPLENNVSPAFTVCLWLFFKLADTHGHTHTHTWKHTHKQARTHTLTLSQSSVWNTLPFTSPFPPPSFYLTPSSIEWKEKPTLFLRRSRWGLKGDRSLVFQELKGKSSGKQGIKTRPV